MSASTLLPATTNATASQQGGIMPGDYKLPSMPAVTDGAQNYENRMAATQSLMQAGNGNLAGGGYRRHRNHVTKVMKGCNNKKTRRNNKNKRHNKRLFRGGANISPTIVGNKIEIVPPVGGSPDQISALKTLTGGLLDAQTAAGNVPPSMPAPVVGMFSGGGRTHRRMNKHRRTKYRRLRHKKSIGRRGRSRRHSGRH
jgi:hypothetical protein